MKTAFAVEHKVFDPSASDSFRIERSVLVSDWDWHPLQVALVLGAVWHAKWQSRKRRNEVAKRAAYASVAMAISGLLHRIGDRVLDIDGDGNCVEKERNPDWARQEDMNLVVADLQGWLADGEPRYRVDSWAPQWELLGRARTSLERFGEDADSAIFNAVLDVEFLRKPQVETCPGRRHTAVIALCDKACEVFSGHTHTFFMVEPIRELAMLLRAVGDAYDIRYRLLRVDNNGRPLDVP